MRNVVVLVSMDIAEPHATVVLQCVSGMFASKLVDKVGNHLCSPLFLLLLARNDGCVGQDKQILHPPTPLACFSKLQKKTQIMHKGFKVVGGGSRGAVKRARSPKKAIAADDFETYTIPWEVALVPGRITVGPLFKKPEDARFLALHRHVTHVVSMVPEVQRTRATLKWQETERERLKRKRTRARQGIAANKEDDAQTPFIDPVQPYANHFAPPNLADEDVALLRADLPDPNGDNALASRNVRAQAEWYVAAAKRLATEVMQDNPRAHVYIHHRDGRKEEAMLGFALWVTLDRVSCPLNKEQLAAWLSEHRCEQLLDTEEDRELYERVVATTAKQSTRLLTWLATTKSK